MISQFSILATFILAVHAFVELPKFSQMCLLYPGYKQYGGHYTNSDVNHLIGGNSSHVTANMRNTASIRMSRMLNQYGGRHAIGTEPILLSHLGEDSYTGKDGQQYIFRNTAFGPFIAAKYGNPSIVKPNRRDHTRTMMPFLGKQGIVRLVSYHRTHAGGHVALWDCKHFFQSKDWTMEQHILSVEFWEAPDSHCPSSSAVVKHPPSSVHVNNRQSASLNRRRHHHGLRTKNRVWTNKMSTSVT